MNRRCYHEIMYNIIKVLEKNNRITNINTTKEIKSLGNTRLMYKANLNTENMKDYLIELNKLGLLENRTITNKGFQFKILYEKILELTK